MSALDGHIERLHAEIERLTLVAEAAEEQSVAAKRGLAQAREDESTARAGFEKAATHASAVTSAAERLLDSPSVAAAFHSPSPDIWHDGPAAADRLAQDAAGAATERVAIELRSADDKRAVDWLDRTGLLPPSPDVERVLATLAKAGVRGAFSGWDVLEHRYQPTATPTSSLSASMLSAEWCSRTRTNSASDRRHSGTFSDAPTVLAVAAALESGDGDTPLVVLAGPAALHDESAASEETDRRQAQLDLADVDTIALAEREGTARNAHAALTTFLEANPANEVARWQAETAEHLSRLELAEGLLREALQALEQAESAARSARSAIQPARDASAEAQRAAKAIQRLVASQARRPQETRNLSEAQARLDDAARQREQATTARTDAANRMTAARELKSDVRVRINDIERTLTRNRLTIVDQTTPEDPTDTLERALELARAALLAAAPPDQLVQERLALQRQRADLSAVLRRRDQEVVGLARTLLASPEAATANARDNATRNAKSILAAAQQRAALTRDVLEKADADLIEKEAVPQARRSPLDDEPDTADEAVALAERRGRSRDGADGARPSCGTAASPRACGRRSGLERRCLSA